MLRNICQVFCVIGGAAILSLSLGACSPGEDLAQTVDIETYPEIAPTDFVLAPCQSVKAEADCVLLAAGGKRVLIGAPAGIGPGKIAGDDIPPDGIILRSLHAETVEGLDEVRNRAWVSGRRAPLIVSGGEGIDQVVSALNQAYLTSDALAYLEGRRKGGFDQEALVADTLSSGDVAFDTGDLLITAYAGGPSRFALLIEYDGYKLMLAGCDARREDVLTWPDADAYIGCAYPWYKVPELAGWPVKKRLKVEY